MLGPGRPVDHPRLRSLAAATIEDAVARVLLDALTPEQVALALAVADEVSGGTSAPAAPPVSQACRTALADGGRSFHS